MGLQATWICSSVNQTMHKIVISKAWDIINCWFHFVFEWKNEELPSQRYAFWTWRGFIIDAGYCTCIIRLIYKLWTPHKETEGYMDELWIIIYKFQLSYSCSSGTCKMTSKVLPYQSWGISEELKKFTCICYLMWMPIQTSPVTKIWKFCRWSCMTS